MLFLLSSIPAAWGLPDMSEVAVAVSASAESMWGCVCSGNMQYAAFFDYLETGITDVIGAISTDPVDPAAIIAAIETAALNLVPLLLSPAMLCSSGCKPVFGEMMSMMVTLGVDLTSAYLSTPYNLASMTGVVNGVWTEEWSSKFSAAISSVGIGMVPAWSAVTDCMCSSSIQWDEAFSKAADTAVSVVTSFYSGATISATIGTELASWADFFFSEAMACGSECRAMMGDMFSLGVQMDMVMLLYIAPWFTQSVPGLGSELDHMLNAIAWMGPNVPNSMIKQMGASLAKTADCVCGGTIAYGELVSTTSSLWTEVDSLIANGESTQGWYELIDAGLESAGKHLDMLFSTKGICGGLCPTVGDEILDMIPQINTIIKTYLSSEGIYGMPDVFPAGAKAMSDAWVSCLCGGEGSMAALTTKARGYFTQAVSNVARLSDPSWYIAVAKDIVPFVMGSTMACSSSCTAAMSASLGVMLEPAMVNYMLPYASSMMPDELPLDLTGLVIPASLASNVAALPYCMCGAIDWTGFITWIETRPCRGCSPSSAACPPGRSPTSRASLSTPSCPSCSPRTSSSARARARPPSPPSLSTWPRSSAPSSRPSAPSARSSAPYPASSAPPL